LKEKAHINKCGFSLVYARIKIEDQSFTKSEGLIFEYILAYTINEVSLKNQH
jgi:hypothetical protein